MTDVEGVARLEGCKDALELARRFAESAVLELSGDRREQAVELVDLIKEALAHRHRLWVVTMADVHGGYDKRIYQSPTIDDSWDGVTIHHREQPGDVS
jgi:hypothetical protein